MAVKETARVDRNAVEELSRRKGEPDWLRKARLEAWELFLELPPPAYERTPVKDEELSRFLPYTPGRPAEGFGALPQEVRALLGEPGRDANVLVQHNSQGVYGSLQEALRSEGVIFTDLDRAVREHADLVRQHLGTLVPAGDGKLAALNAALWSGGAFVYVPEGVEVELPLQSLVWVDGRGAGVLDRVLVITGPRSRVHFVESAASAPGTGGRRCAVAEVFPGRGATVGYLGLQVLGDDVLNLVVRRAKTAERSTANWLLAEFGSHLSVSEFSSVMEGRGSESQLQAVFFASGRQHLDVEPRAFHTGSETSSSIVVRGVVKDRARAMYGPYTRVEHDAKDANAHQRGNTLVLDREAKAHSMPRLNVMEDEVQGAGHAATIGKVDPEQLFYLMSRGLRAHDAQRLIVDGFFYPLLEKIPVPTVRAAVEGFIAEKIVS